MKERSALDELIKKMRVGRLTRRSFIERAIGMGLTSAAALSLLEACGGSNSNTTALIWQSESETTNTYKNLVEVFNNSIGKQKGIHVTWKQGPSNSTDMLTIYNNTLRARSKSLDVLSLDVVYPAQFASNHWLKEISESQWPKSERDKYLPAPVRACTYNNKVWAAPLRTDAGLLYFRKDLVPAAPETWDELINMAKANSPAKIKYGYIWQGSQYEGLVCNFVEVVHGYGGDVLDSWDPTRVIVNSSQARVALEQMVSWVGDISPDAVTTYQEESARNLYQNGDAVFMRNWPYAYELGNDASQSKIADKFDIAHIPYGGSGNGGHSAIGGWNLAINAYSDYPEQSWEFIKFMLEAEAQKKIAVDASLTPVLLSTYEDQEVLTKQPLFGKIKPILQAAQPRPVSDQYTNVSDAIQRNIYQALKKKVSPKEALSDLEADLKKIVTVQG